MREFAVYLRGPGTVVRCRHRVMLVIVEAHGVSCVYLQGLEALVCAALFAASGAIGLVNPRRDVEAAVCAGRQLVGAPQASLPQQA